MMSQARWRAVLLWTILVVVGANYLAQIPYYLHLYYFPHHVAPSTVGSVLLGGTLVWFLVGYARLLVGSAKGYWLLVSFLATEVFFYAYNMTNQVMHGYPPFLHMQGHDPILFVVFGIGYLNLIMGVFFLGALLLRQRMFLSPASAPGA
ncbi:MAG TPA: hypothetical protein VE338_18740 [Ktedonobacterales bacterium]|nr:hypothetical protein [Ktedonobacterales bacterium]